MRLLTKLPRFGLPLLMKELQEQSARTRTFVLRIAYAILLIFAVGLFNSHALFEIGNRGVVIGSNLGMGNQFFQSIVVLQFVGIYLFLPAMVCGVLTVEKERNTLGLLLITKLGPWTIIFEKFASRIVPMLTFLLLSLPLLSFTYSLGGLESATLFFGLWFLLLSVLQIGSVAILASSFFSGTVGSFLGTYFLLGVLSFGPAILDFVLLHDFLQYFARFFASHFLRWMFGSNVSMEFMFGELALGMFMPPALLQFCVMANGDFYGSMTGSTLKHPYWFAFFCGLPTMMSTGVSLALARFFLIRRAFTSSTNPILSLFKWLDRIFVLANQRLTGGVVLVKESQRMPDLQPVAWRETAKRSLGQFRYLVRVFVTLEFPTFFLVFLAATGSSGNDASSGPVSALMFFLWIVSVVLIGVTASNLIAGERSRQTLDVLLTTPIVGRDLILQKMRGVKRLMLVCAVPVLTCIIFQTWWKTQLGRFSDPYNSNRFGYEYASQFDWLEYLITSLAGLFILFHLTMWLAFWIGMKLKSPSKAILTSLGVQVAWCSLPSMLTLAMMIWVDSSRPPGYDSEHTGIMLWYLNSPAFLVVYSEFQSLRRMTPTPYLPVIVNSLIYGGCWLLIRNRVLSRADENLARMNSETPALCTSATEQGA
ncbi:MAG: hypothetical protein JWM11_5780 [Planctomycetaceae bacterium]|nr:hypothetical protein [Planctomycetaceae bacterium]